MPNDDFSVTQIDLSYETAPKRRISAMQCVKHPAATTLELSVLVCFRSMDPVFLRLSREVVTDKLSAAVKETLQQFIDDFLEIPAAESSVEVTGNE